MPFGTQVNLTAEPDYLHYFFRWAGDYFHSENDEQSKNSRLDINVYQPNPVFSALFAEKLNGPDNVKILSHYYTGGFFDNTTLIQSDNNGNNP